MLAARSPAPCARDSSTCRRTSRRSRRYPVVVPAARDARLARRSTSTGRNSPSAPTRRLRPSRLRPFIAVRPGCRDEAWLQRRVGRAVGEQRSSTRRSRGSTRTCRRSRPPGGRVIAGPLRRWLRRDRHRAAPSRAVRRGRVVERVLRAITRRAVQRRWSRRSSPRTIRRSSSSAIDCNYDGAGCGSSSPAARRTATGSARLRRCRSPASCARSACRCNYGCSRQGAGNGAGSWTPA